jgi:geranylgeranyl diphosphate synthase type II
VTAPSLLSSRPPSSLRPPAAGLDRDVEQFLQELGQQLDAHFQRAADQVGDIPALKDGVVYQIETGGKRIRAALCACVCEMFCASYRPALSFAAAIEHLQNFTLIHDDIADGDTERRGHASAWKRFGLAHGVNIGDIFIPLSALAILEADYAPALKLRLLQILSEYGLDVAEGQGMDINLRHNDAPRLEDYIACTRKKTGAFLAMAAVGGAIIGGAGARHLEHLRQFALTAGVAFQIKDDLLDCAGGKGRAVGSDVLEGKRTTLVVFAAAQAGPADRQRLFEILNRPAAETSSADVAWVHQLYQGTHARQKSEELAEALIDEALEHLAELPETAAKYRFLRLSRHLTRRVH